MAKVVSKCPLQHGVRIVVGGLSSKVWAVTKWRDDPDRGPDAWEAVEKIDVSDQLREVGVHCQSCGYVGKPDDCGCGGDMRHVAVFAHPNEARDDGPDWEDPRDREATW